MEYLPIIMDAFLKLLDGLELFFFSSINELTQSLPSQLLGLDGPLGVFLDKVITFFSKLTILGWLGDLTVFELLLGSGVIVVLVYKLILFFVPVAD